MDKFLCSASKPDLGQPHQAIEHLPDLSMATNMKLQETIRALESIRLEDVTQGNHDRLQLAEAARSLLARIETPFERAWRLAATDTAVHSARQTVDNLGLWEGWAKSGVTEASVEDLVGLCKTPCDPVLLGESIALNQSAPEAHRLVI